MQRTLCVNLQVDNMKNVILLLYIALSEDATLCIQQNITWLNVVHSRAQHMYKEPHVTILTHLL